MKSRTPFLIVISAPSGAGKTTLCQRLLVEFPNLKLSISSTTRAPRGSEKDGVEYHFLTSEAFKDGIDQGRFAEWAQVHGNYYGTAKQTIESNFKKGYSVLLDIDVQGAELLRQAFPKQCFSIFIAPPSMEELERRLRARKTEREEVILKRLENAKSEMDQKHLFDAVVVNDSLDNAYAQLKALVEKKIR
ncbi:MAG: guanylate kinase [Bdellovibrio sp.]|nr:guanylate kinase [Bdellovibrio sp.]